MAQIFLKVSDHRITVNTGAILSQDSNEYDSIKFEFDSTWDGYTPSAILYQKITEPLVLELTDGMCSIPSVVLKDNTPLYVGARGISTSGDDKRVTTQMVSFQVFYGAIKGNNSTSLEIGNDDLEKIWDAIAGKVSIKQSTLYSGKFLGVDSHGIVKPLNLPNDVWDINDDNNGNIEFIAIEASDDETISAEDVATLNEVKSFLNIESDGSDDSDDGSDDIAINDVATLDEVKTFLQL